VLLEQGLAGFEETQEALAVVSEHLIGGLDAERMRTLAGRVVAARCVSDGAGFPEVFGVLHERWGLPERQAWSIAMRVVRGGGLTKDVIYLRGVVELVSHLAGGGAVEPLLVGKLHLLDVPAVEELLGRGVLVPPTVRPHWLDVGGRGAAAGGPAGRPAPGQRLARRRLTGAGQVTEVPWGPKTRMPMASHTRSRTAQMISTGPGPIWAISGNEAAVKSPPPTTGSNISCL
jgi:hypothetical protein